MACREALIGFPSENFCVEFQCHSSRTNWRNVMHSMLEKAPLITGSSRALMVDEIQ
jgi:hypothetical protein